MTFDLSGTVLVERRNAMLKYKKCGLGILAVLAVCTSATAAMLSLAVIEGKGTKWPLFTRLQVGKLSQ